MQWEQGRETSPMFFEQPDIDGELGDLWSAFSELGTERQFGMGIGPIPRSAIIAYGQDDLGLSGDSLDRFVAIIRAADSDYLSFVNGSKPDDPKMRTLVPMNDAKGISKLMDRLARKPNQPEHHKKPKKPQ